MKKFWRWENKAAVDEISGAPALKRTLFLDGVIARSEERRVGKEC